MNQTLIYTEFNGFTATNRHFIGFTATNPHHYSVFCLSSCIHMYLSENLMVINASSFVAWPDRQ